MKRRSRIVFAKPVDAAIEKARLALSDALDRHKDIDGVFYPLSGVFYQLAAANAAIVAHRRRRPVAKKVA